MINTNGGGAAGFDLDEQGVWHRPSDPHALKALLLRLGVWDGQPSDEALGGNAAASAPAGRDGGTAMTALWALPVLGAGLAMGLVGRPVATAAVHRWRERDGGPRHQLIDL